MATLTAANSALALQIINLYNAPQSIQGYATDDAFAVDDQSMVEALMGVDGALSGGYTPVPTLLNITLQADSPSNDIFDNWVQAMRAAREVYIANASIRIPSLGKVFAFTRGFLTAGSTMTSAKKILQPRKYVITFQDCQPANM